MSRTDVTEGYNGSYYYLRRCMPLNQKSDEQLMILYQNGTEAAFKMLFDRHSSKIFGFIKNRLKAPEQCQDVFQEVFMKIHKSKHLYNKSHPVLPWLFTITKNAIVDHFRKAKKTLNQIQIDDLEIAAPIMDAAFSLSDVSSYMSEIPAKQRTVIEMRYTDEKTFADIAEVLETSDVNVRKLLSRGLSRLKQLIKESEKS